jgi:hypothetical protein
MHGCYLDDQKLARGEGWHAYCRPLRNATVAEPEAAVEQSASITSQLLERVTSSFMFYQIHNFSSALSHTVHLCEGSTEGWCRGAVLEGFAQRDSFREEIERDVELTVEEVEKVIPPLTIGLIVIGSLILVGLLVLCAVYQYFHMRQKLIQAELEMQALRVFTESRPAPPAPPSVPRPPPFLRPMQPSQDLSAEDASENLPSEAASEHLTKLAKLTERVAQKAGGPTEPPWRTSSYSAVAPTTNDDEEE